MKYLFTIILLILFTWSFAQSIKGRVVDKDDKPLQFVSVLVKKDSVKISSTISDQQGAFTINKPALHTACHLVLSLVGYKTIDTTIVSDESMMLKIVMFIQENQLKGVTVSSRKNILERKVDRLIFNVENNINTAGLNALDLLDKTPMVRVEENSISLVGKESVDIMLDNKLLHLSPIELANLLKTIGADNVSKIEVITNPPAQYDAAGNSGLINIVTKKKRQPGYSGSVNAGVSRGTYTSFGEGINLNYNLKRLLMFGSLNTGQGAYGSTSKSTRYYESQTWDGRTNNKENSDYWSQRFGFEYLLTDKTTLGASFFHSSSNPNSSGNSNTTIINNATKATDSILSTPYGGSKAFNATTFNLHLNQKLDSNKTTLIADVDYFKSTGNIHNNSWNQNFFPDGKPISPATELQSNNDVGSKGATFNTEIDMHLAKSTLVFGGKATFLESNSNVGFFRNTDGIVELDSTASNSFRFNQNIEALFGSFNTTFGKIEVQVGLRAEATQAKGFSVTLNQTNTNAYVGFFPTLYFTYNLGDKDVLSVNYGRRIGRPNFSSLNPFRIYYNQYDYSTGNPYLKPSYSDNFELSNTFNRVLNTSLSYNINTSLPTRIQIIQNGSNASVSIIENSNTSKSFSLDNSASFTIFKWWESTNSTSVYYVITRSTSVYTLPRVEGFGADISSSNSVYLNKDKTLVAGLDFKYQFPYTSGLTYYRKNYRVDLSGTYTLLDNKLQLSGSLSDIFKTRTVVYSTITNGLETAWSSNNDSRRANFSLRYLFGNTKLRNGRGHSVSGAEQGLGK